MSPLSLIDWLAGKWLDWRVDQVIKKLPPELQGLELRKAEFGREGWEIVMLAPAVAELASQAAALLEHNNAKNYVTFDMMPRLDRAMRPVRVTVAWAHGMSPSHKASRLASIFKLMAETAQETDNSEYVVVEAKLLRDGVFAGQTEEEKRPTS